MASTLADLMKNGGGASAPQQSAPISFGPTDTEPVRNTAPEPTRHGLSFIAGVRVDVVLAGALMEVEFAAGVNPANVPDILRGLDPNAKFRDDFPKGGFGGGGKRDTKTARVLAIQADIRGDGGKFIEMTASDGVDDMMISVGKKVADEWLGKVKALGKLSEKNLAKLEAAFENKKGKVVVLLTDSEQFAAAYWKTEDGKCFLEEMKPEPPAVVEGGAS
jgi:hypothetical protein